MQILQFILEHVMLPMACGFIGGFCMGWFYGRTRRWDRVS